MSPTNSPDFILRVAYLPFPLYTIEEQRNNQTHVFGITGSVLDNITTAMNITYKLVFAEDLQWGVKLANGSYTGQLKALADNKADLALGPHYPVLEHTEDFEPALPHNQVAMDIMSGMQRAFASNIFACFTAFSTEVWITVISVLLFLSAMTALLRPPVTFDRVVRSLLTYFEVMLQEATSTKRLTWAARFVLGGWMLSSMVFMNSFTGLLKASLMIKSPTDRIDSMEDLSRRPDVVPLIFDGSPVITTIARSQIESYRKVHSMVLKNGGMVPLRELFSTKHLQMLLERQAVILHGQYMSADVGKDCHKYQGLFYFSHEKFLMMNLIWYYRKDLDKGLRLAIDKRVRWLTESAVPFVRHHDVHPSVEECFLHSGQVPEEEANQALSYSDLQPFFLLHVLLLTFSVVLCAFEVVLGKTVSCKKRR
ncbi:glutamate receptor ionotropic, kainate 5-like [Ixodes scapularis]